MVAAADLVDGMAQERLQDGEPVPHPAGDPGRFTISVVPATPASPRESAAVGTFSRPYARIASGMPGISRSRTRRVASGVSSVGEMPVPPVVTITSYPAATPSRSAASTGAPSGTTCGPSTANRIRVRPSAISGPPLSSYTPADARLEAVTTSAR